MTTSTPPLTNLEWALYYGSQGVPVGPQYSLTADGRCTCTKGVGCRKPGKHPNGRIIGQNEDGESGSTLYTTDEATIRRWWGEDPDAPIGADPERAGIVDVAPDSWQWSNEFRRRGLPETAQYRSSYTGGHEHHWYRRPAGCPPARITRSGEYDVMAKGNTVLPAAAQGAGAPREWLTPGVPELNGSLPDAPAWVVAMLREAAAGEAEEEARRSDCTWDGPAPSIDPIVNGCAWLQHCRDDAKALGEPEWYAMLSIVGRCEGGEQLAHAWSKPYPAYTHKETVTKLKHALAGAGPRTCRNIRDGLGGETYCDGCPNWGKVASPITVGQPRATLNANRKGARGTEEEEVSAEAPSDPGPPPEPRTLAEVIATFHRWLYLEDDGLVLFVLGLIAANMREGDPTWGMVVGGSSAGKTEPLIASAGLPHVHLVGTIASEGALLSGVTRKDRAKDATGGLLRKVGDFGILLLKDFTSIISMQRDARASVLAALREIHDGGWVRNVGADGGRELSWKGKLGIVAACTTAIDTAHSVSGLLGERFIYYRLPDYDRQAQGLQAIGNLRHTETMRKELAGAVLGLLATLDPAATLPELTTAEAKRFVALADLAALCRTGVDRDPRSREIDLIPDAEGPARLAGTLARLYDGMRAIGVEERESWRIIQKVAFDSMPKVRRGVFDVLRHAEPATWTPTPTIATSIDYPTTTARRSLEDLTVHGVARRRSGRSARAEPSPGKVAASKGGGKPPDEWQLSPRARTLLAEGFVPEMSDTYTPEDGPDDCLNQPLPRVGDISGTNPPDGPLPLWSENDWDEDGTRQAGCWRCKAGVAEDSETTCDACGWLVCAECGACAEDCSGAATDEQAACPACAGPGSSRADGLCYACAAGGTA